MKKNFRRIVSVLFTMAIVASMASVVFAHDITIVDTNQFDNVLGRILGFVQIIGYAFGTGMLLYIGIKYMMASANEKADLKKGAINYVIGAVLVFGATAVVGFIKNFAGEIK